MYTIYAKPVRLVKTNISHRNGSIGLMVISAMSGAAWACAAKTDYISQVMSQKYINHYQERDKLERTEVTKPTKPTKNIYVQSGQRLLVKHPDDRQHVAEWGTHYNLMPDQTCEMYPKMFKKTHNFRFSDDSLTLNLILEIDLCVASFSKDVYETSIKSIRRNMKLYDLTDGVLYEMMISTIEEITIKYDTIDIYNAKTKTQICDLIKTKINTNLNEYSLRLKKIRIELILFDDIAY